jgi:hypothetical protein
VVTEDTAPIWRRIEDETAAKVLVNLEELKYLRPFLACECTVSAAAKQLGINLTTMHYQVQRLLDLELLTISRVQPRAGRPIKYYRSSADVFFVPLRVMPKETFEDSFIAFEEPLHARFTRNIFACLLEAIHDFDAWGLVVSRGDDNWVEMNLDVEGGGGRLFELIFNKLDGPALWASWETLTLDFERAKALQRELGTLFERYRGERGAQRYLLRLGLVPVPAKD